MKFFYCVLLFSVSLTSQAWDGSGYDYKTGRSTKMTQDFSMHSSETIHYSTTHSSSPKYREHDQTIFQRLGDSFTVNIPDPSDRMQTVIESTPYLPW